MGCVSVQCNIRVWCYPARAGIYSMWDGIPKIKIHVCICIEARDDAEMNETALGACRATHLHCIDDLLVDCCLELLYI